MQYPHFLVVTKVKDNFFLAFLLFYLQHLLRQTERFQFKVFLTLLQYTKKNINKINFMLHAENTAIMQHYFLSTKHIYLPKYPTVNHPANYNY